MKRVEKMLGNVLEGLLASAFLAIFVLVVIQVVLRYLFNSSITGANEFIVILFVYTTSIGGAIAAGRGEHIALTFAVERLWPNLQRWVRCLQFLLVAFLNVVMVWFSMGWIETTGDYLMPSTGLARRVVQLAVPLGCGLAAVYCLVKAFSTERIES